MYLKLSLNKDFSFIRFLKVVKTLYESSTFTQLGKTVGSALGPSSSPDNMESVRRERERSSSKYSAKRNVERGETIFDTLARACTSVHFDHKTNSKRTDNSIEEIRDKPSSDAGSLIEKVLNCTMMERDEDYSYEDSFKSNSFGVGSSSFESMTDEEEPHRSHTRRRRRR